MLKLHVFVIFYLFSIFSKNIRRNDTKIFAWPLLTSRNTCTLTRNPKNFPESGYMGAAKSPQSPLLLLTSGLSRGSVPWVQKSNCPVCLQSSSISSRSRSQKRCMSLGFLLRFALSGKASESPTSSSLAHPALSLQRAIGLVYTRWQSLPW